MNSNYPNVGPGQEWFPEPAQRYNAVNALLSSFGQTGDGRSRSGKANRSVFTAINRSNDTIYAGMAVEPSGGAQESGELVPVKISAVGNSKLWGVSLTTLAPKETGTVLLTGVVTVPLTAALPTGTAYVAPGAGGKFVAATSGRAQVVATKDLSAIVVLGTDSGEDTSPVPAIVGAGSDLGGYEIILYAKGYAHPATGYSIAFLLQGNAQIASVPRGTKVMVYPYANFIQTVG